MTTETEAASVRPSVAYSWQQAQWQRLADLHRDRRLPHALMLAGPAGTGKRHFADCLAALLLCLSPVNQVACGRCKGCDLVRAGTHPDLLMLQPEEKSRVIKISQVREATDFLAKTGQQGGRKVALIQPAEALNVNAANALLKSLEEPAGDTTLILVSHAPSQVMATIRSRCQLVDFPIPETSVSLAWLAPLVTGHKPEYLLHCAGGAPVAARDLLQGDVLEQRQELAGWLQAIGQARISPLDVAAKLSGDPLQTVEWMLQWVQAGIRAAVTGVDEGLNEVEAPLLEALAAVPEQIGFRFMDKLMQLKRQLLSNVALNKQLLQEELMLDWQALMKQSALLQQSRQQMVNGLL
ncbi:DNA polymerase III subunit delta' [Pseudomaricurvus sp. HS19]|uniref:DNA polymerase III subunit delta' n=1 Tax=Pseudomaricurvus sp. HS19 TaxID=2692626 RepID=UPI001369B7BC|nr:DNA polymerase III subunit delta' [Pseudomaricurvus sp. HS19]MYM62182.1 DNA polymerase III subunit delta' [Pseudomaricurvus sp. HS19]